jgi:hypothetical protein
MAFVYFSRTISIRQWLVALLLFSLLSLSVSSLWSLIPAQPPVSIVGEGRGEIMPSGRWRVTRTIARTRICGSEVWNRTFRTTDGDRRFRAVASSSGTALDPTTAGTAGQIGTYEAWWEYEVVPGLSGSYIVTLSAGWCPNGYSDVEAVYVVPFDWR